MTEHLDAILTVVGMILAAGATYGAIKSDLKNMHEKITDHAIASAERMGKIEEEVQYNRRRLDDHHSRKGD